MYERLNISEHRIRTIESLKLTLPLDLPSRLAAIQVILQKAGSEIQKTGVKLRYWRPSEFGVAIPDPQCGVDVEES